MSNSRNEETMVARMQFDNKQFERDVAVTMSSIDKLKSKLGFEGASKGLAEISENARKVSFNGITSGIETVQAKFSALNVVAATVLSNITTAAMQTGTAFVNAVATDPLKDGLAEYETQINAIQTILNNTKRHGSTLGDVNDALDELNTYADKTIYNFTQMTDAIGMFTTAGVDLQTSVNAVKGIANLAAYVGAPASDASRAMFQLSQALATGEVRLQDWMSIEHTAGMAGIEFQDRLKETARILGTGVDEAIEKNGNFRESLKEGWLTTEVLNQTLAQFAGEVDEATLRSQGWSESQIASILELGETATQAATKVKTFSQLIDTLKEALGSGWTKSWQLIIGDFDQAQEMWTKVSNVLGDVIQKWSDARNNLIEKAMGNPFAEIADSINTARDAIGALSGDFKTYDDLVTSIIRGDFGNAPTRFEELSAAGYNWAKAQNMVNERLGCSFRYAEELGGSTEELAKSQAEAIQTALAMSDAELKALGLTDDQIKALRLLEEQSKRTKIPIEELLQNVDLLNGRNLMLNGIANFAKGLANIFKDVGEAAGNVFDPITATTLYNILASMHGKSVEFLTFTEEHGEQIVRILTGAFSILDLIRKTVTGGITLGIKGLNAVLGVFDMDILEFAAKIADLITEFNKWVDTDKAVEVAGKNLGEGIKWLVDRWNDLVAATKEVPAISKFLDSIKDVDLKDVGENIIDGLKNGIEEGVDVVPKSIKKVITALIEKAKELLGIASPSKVMHDIGFKSVSEYGNGIIESGEQLKTKAASMFTGIGDNIKDTIGKVFDVLSTVFKELDEFADKNNINVGTMINLGMNAAIIKQISSFIGFLDKLAGPAEGLGKVLESTSGIIDEVKENIGTLVKSFDRLAKAQSKKIKAQAFKKKADAIKEIAISLAIVAASVYMLSRLKTDELERGIIAITAIATVVGVLAIAIDAMSQSDTTINRNGIQFKGMQKGLVSIGIIMILMAKSVSMMGSMDPDEMKRGFLGIAGCVIAVSVIFAAYGTLVKGSSAKNIDKAGKMISKMTKSLLLLVIVCKLAGTLNSEEIAKGAGFMVAFIGFVTLMNLVSNLAGKKTDKLGKYIMSITVALGLMALVCKIIGTLSLADMGKGMLFATGFSAFVAALLLITKINSSGSIPKLSGLLLSITVSMALMTKVCKMIGELSVTDMIKSGIFISAFVVFLAAVVSITRTNSSRVLKVSKLMISLTIAIGGMALVASLLGKMDTKELAKGILAVSMLGAILALILSQLKNSGSAYKSILALTVAISAISIAVGSLAVIDQDRLKSATACLAVLMALFALVAKVSGEANVSIKSVGIMLTAVAGLSAIFIAIMALVKVLDVSDLNVNLESVASISVIMATIAGILTLLSRYSNIGDMSVKDVGKMLAAMTGLSALFVGMMGLFKLFDLGDVKMDLQSVAAMSAVMVALSGCAVILSKIGPVGDNAAIGAAKMMAVVGAAALIFEGIAGLIGMIPGAEEFLDKGIVVLKKLGEGLGSFFGSIFAGFEKTALSGLPDMGNDIKEFVNSFSGVDSNALSSVKTVVDVMATMTKQTLFDSVYKFTHWGKSSMEAFGEQSIAFGQAIQTLSDNLSGININEESITKVANIGGMLSALANGLPPQPGAIKAWFVDNKDLGNFGGQVNQFADGVGAFIDMADSANVDETKIKAIVNIGEMLKGLKASLPPDPGFIKSWFVDNQNLSNFGEQVKGFGAGVSAFCVMLNDTNIDEDKINKAIAIGKALNEFQSSLEKSPGAIAEWFVGSKDMGDFGEQAEKFATGISKFCNTAAWANIDEEKSKNIINVGKMLAGLMEALPETPGAIADWFTSSVHLDNFGDDAAAFGSGIKEFIDSISGINVNAEAITKVINIANDMVKIQEALMKIDTSQYYTLDSFAQQINSFGGSLTGFNNNVGDIDTSKISTSVEAGKMIFDLLKSMKGVKEESVKGICTAIDDYSSQIKTYNNDVSDLNSENVFKSISIGNSLIAFFRNLTSANINTEAISNFKTAVNTLGETQLGQIQNTLNQQKLDFSSTGQSIVDTMGSGITDNKQKAIGPAMAVIKEILTSISGTADKFKQTGSNVMTSFANGLNSVKEYAQNIAVGVSYYSASGAGRAQNSFYNNGMNLGYGLVNGINAMQNAAYNAGYALGQAAVRGERDGQRSHSPSKDTYQSGLWLGQGLINGISAISMNVEGAGKSMGSRVTSAIDNALSSASAAIGNSIDISPVITPVVDLSGVEETSSRLDGLFDSPSVAVSANIGSVSRQYNNAGQNGQYDTIISSIDRLRKSMSGTGNTYNSINGLTYERGTEVSDAIETLVRATMIERRR